jgi:tricorn protease-like protein
MPEIAVETTPILVYLRGGAKIYADTPVLSREYARPLNSDTEEVYVLDHLDPSSGRYVYKFGFERPL